MTRQQLLAESIRESRFLLVRYFKGFDDTNHTKQAPSLPNHLAWTLGHLAFTMNRTAEKLDGLPMPESDFVMGDDKSGGRDRFDAESVCFGSKPAADPAIYPTWDRCVAIFESAIDRLAQAAAHASDAALDAPAKWGKADVPTWSLLTRMVFHNGTHCGQIADLRRALGMGTILG